MDITTLTRVYSAALLKKLRRISGLPINPYPSRPEGSRLSPSVGLIADTSIAARRLAYDHTNIINWQKMGRSHLAKITGYQETAGSPNLIAKHGPYTVSREPMIERTTFYLRVGQETDVPVTLVLNRNNFGKLPVFIYLAGSTSGVHIGWGEAKEPIDHQRISVGADMALQAARRGYLAVCVEQVGYGERLERDLPKPSKDRTIDFAVHAALLGRSLLGQKATDVSATINWLLKNDEDYFIDPERIFLFGHSTGGTAAQFTAALDLRIKGVLASGSVRRVSEIVATRGNDNGEYLLPGFFDAFETDDIIALIAPRPFVAISGKNDHIFPYNGVVRTVEGARASYQALGASKQLLAVSGSNGHRYYSKESWQVWNQTIDPAIGGF